MPTWTFGATKASAKRSSGDSFEPFAPRSSRKREMKSSPVWMAERFLDRGDRPRGGGRRRGEEHRVALLGGEPTALHRLAQRAADRRRSEGGAEVGEDLLRVAVRFAEDVAVDIQDPRRLVLHPVVVPLLRHPKGASLATTARSPKPSWIPFKNLRTPCTFSLSSAQTKNML